jgi:hypothetical protein
MARADQLPPGVPYAAATDPVAITAVSYVPHQIKPGDTVLAQVTCTSNVAAVTAQVGNFRVPLAKRAPGIFQTHIYVPRPLPFGPHQTVVVTAIRADGATVQRTFSIDIH